MTRITDTADTGQTTADEEPTEANLARWDALGDAMAGFVIRHARNEDEHIGFVCWFTWCKLTYALAAQGWDEDSLISQVRRRVADAREQAALGYPTSDEIENAS
jgi:hypothetical protein